MTNPLNDPKAAAAKIDELIEENADYFSGWHEAHLGEPSTHGKWKARAMATEAALEAAQAENAKLRAALQEIARQNLICEMAEGESSRADFEGAYEACVERARGALEAHP